MILKSQFKYDASISYIGVTKALSDTRDKWLLLPEYKLGKRAARSSVDNLIDCINGEQAHKDLIEYAVTIPVLNKKDTNLVGFLDGVSFDTKTITEYKSVSAYQAFDHSLQIAVYTYMAEQVTGIQWDCELRYADGHVIKFDRDRALKFVGMFTMRTGLYI